MELPPFSYIDTPQAWQACLATLEEADQLAVDLESNSMYVFREEVCLIQISTPAQDFIIDPLVGLNLSPLKTLLADPNVEKIFHAAEYDLILIRRQFDWPLNNLFDTMWAARILGYKRIGLANMMAELFDIELDKRYQRADWGKRPLSAEQLAYAQRDTHYLFQLRERLGKELIEGGHIEEAAEIFAWQAQVQPGNDPFDPNRFWSLNGISELTPQEKSVAFALYNYRQQLAEKLNRPLFKLIGNSVLLRMAEQQPRSMQDLYRLKGLGNWLVRRYGVEMLRVIDQGLKNKPPKRPRPPRRPPQAVLDRYEKLHQWRRDRAVARGVESDVVMSKDALWLIARENPKSMQEIHAHQEVIGRWRSRTYGAEILQVLNGKQGQ
ncbi:MAG: HRDC domain-containing protein [Ardenticatenaceae bacterium]|nr:HRDC domain-containing protein [Ardenticatenaceae bacterium]